MRPAFIAVPLFIILSLSVFIGGEEYNTLKSKEDISPDYIRHFNDESGDWVLRSSIDEGQMEEGMWEVTKFPYSEPSKTQINEAWELYRRSFKVAQKNGWFDPDEALSSGFSPISSHALNKNNLQDNETLIPKRPEYLVYYTNNEENILAGMMYSTNHVPYRSTLGGPLTKWHFHKYNQKNCFTEDLINTSSRDCPPEDLSMTSPEMLHVWFIDHPNGPFATNMSILSERHKSFNTSLMSKDEFMASYNIH